MKPATTPEPAGPSLRDIHLPPDPSWWPPAPGWWGLGAIAILALLAIVWLLRRRRLQQQRLHAALADVDALARRHADAPERLAAALHELLRRAARRYDPQATHHRGEAWRRCLAQVPVDAATLERLMALEEAMYRPGADVAGAPEAVRRWFALALRRNRPPRASTLGGGSHA